METLTGWLYKLAGSFTQDKPPEPTLNEKKQQLFKYMLAGMICGSKTQQEPPPKSKFEPYVADLLSMDPSLQQQIVTDVMSAACDLPQWVIAFPDSTKKSFTHGREYSMGVYEIPDNSTPVLLIMTALETISSKAIEHVNNRYTNLAKNYIRSIITTGKPNACQETITLLTNNQALLDETEAFLYQRSLSKEDPQQANPLIGKIEKIYDAVLNSTDRSPAGACASGDGGSSASSLFPAGCRSNFNSHAEITHPKPGL